MIVETYNIEKTIINVDDSFFSATEDERDSRISVFNNLLTSLIQKINSKKK